MMVSASPPLPLAMVSATFPLAILLVCAGRGLTIISHFRLNHKSHSVFLRMDRFQPGRATAAVLVLRHTSPVEYAGQ
jgi:hypothetical protein